MPPTDEKQKADEQYDPYTNARDLYRQEQDGYNQDTSQDGRGYDKTSNAASESAHIENARQQEEAPQQNLYTGRGNAKKKITGKANFFKKKGPLIGVGSGIAGVLALLSFGSGVLAPFMLVESASSDLNDKLAATQVRSGYINRNKLLSTRQKAKVIKGCTTLSIRCKFSTVGSREKARLNRAGIEVISNEKSLFGREIPDKYKFKDKTFTADQWAKELRTNQAALNAQTRANNMKFINFADNAFITRVLGRFGLSKAPPGVKGSVSDRINQLLTAADTSTASDLKFEPVTDSDGNAVKPARYNLIDANGEVVGDHQYTQKQKTKAEDSLKKIKATKTPKPGIKELAGAASILGIYDLTCTINNMLGAGTVAAKVAANQDLVKYSWSVFRLVHKIKSGDGTVEDGQVLGKLLSDTDNRNKIIDLAKTAKTKTDATKPNPNYGKSAMDSELVKMSINGGVAPHTESQKAYSLGFDLPNSPLRSGQRIKDNGCGDKSRFSGCM